MTDVAPRRSIFYHPRQPAEFHKVEFMRRLAGWDLADSPEAADWCVLHQDATWITLPEDDPWAELSTTWINGRCRDISKRKVERVFEAVFGYPLEIDPLTHNGYCLRKSDKNYVKDAVVLECPIPSSEFDERFVYERLVDSRIPQLGITELCASIVGGVVVTVRRWIHPDWFSRRYLSRAILDEVAVMPDSVFSQQELENIATFCGAMGLDLGELNIMRDRDDGQIYIFDVNNTPSYDLDRVWGIEELEHVTRAFTACYPPATAFREASIPAEEPSPAAGRPMPNGWGVPQQTVATRIDMQSGRIARLETEVEELTAGIALLLAAQLVDSQSLDQRKRKR
jgi:hypothetical protein